MESKFNYKNFSIVIPIYNEEEILEESTNAIFSICKRMGIDFEIIFSENGSTDNTKKIASELTAKYSEIKIVSNSEPNYGNALKAGFELAKYGCVISLAVVNDDVVKLCVVNNIDPVVYIILCDIIYSPTVLFFLLIFL